MPDSTRNQRPDILAAVIGALLSIAVVPVSSGCTVNDELVVTPPTPDPPAVCQEMADVVGNATARCDEDYAANYAAFINSAASGDCANVVAIRDEASLYAQCIPWLESAPCDDLRDVSQVPDSCRGQLIVR